MVNLALEGFVMALSLELTQGRRIVLVHSPQVKETAQAMGMDDSQSPMALEVAQTYLIGLENNEKGVTLFFKSINV